MYEKYDKEAIRASVDFAALVAEDTELHEQGGELHGACPFGCEERVPHTSNEPRDRFWLDKERRNWWCRYCEGPKPRGSKIAGGDVYSYVQKLYPDLSFPQACAYLEDFAAEHGPYEPVEREPAAGQEPETIDWLPSVTGSPVAVQYLVGQRGIPLELAVAAQVGCDVRGGFTHVSFPFINQAGEPVAYLHRKVVAVGRQHDGDADLPKGAGIFVARALEPIDNSYAAVESPIDALSLAAAGQNAVAVGGITGGPAWLGDWLKAGGAERVWLAQDNDGNGAGDQGVSRVAANLANSGLVLERLKPAGKDWNDDLRQLGLAGLRDRLAGRVPEKSGGAEQPVETPLEERRNGYHQVEQPQAKGGVGGSSRFRVVHGERFDCPRYDLADEVTIEWLVPQARGWPYVREQVAFLPDTWEVMPEHTRRHNEFLVAVATLKWDARCAYPAEDDAGAYYWRRSWWARVYDPFGPPCVPIEAVDPSTIEPGRVAKRVVQWEYAA